MKEVLAKADTLKTLHLECDWLVGNYTPILIMPFLAVIEFLSYVAKGFSLGIRLFTNMLSGHTLLKILVGSSVASLKYGLCPTSILIISFTLIILVLMLESLIAFFQAYVFATLASIYIDDSVK